MTDEPEFPSPRRHTKPPARPEGLHLTGPQKSWELHANALYSQARREGWTRARFYYELNRLPNAKEPIRDNLLDRYKAPGKLRKQKKSVPDGYTPRTLQESAIEMVNYVQDIDEDGADYVIVEEEGGYRAYVQPDSPSPYAS